MAFGFEFFRPDGSVLFDSQWPCLTFESKLSGTNMYNSRDTSKRLYDSNRIEAFTASGNASGTVYVFSTLSRAPVSSRGFQFFRPDGTTIICSDFPPMKVVAFRNVTEANRPGQTINIPSGRTYAVCEISTVGAGMAVNVVHEPPLPPTYEEWWAYQWRNRAIRPVWVGSQIQFQIVEWSDGIWYESDTGTIQPVDRYLKYDCMIIDVTGL